MSQFTFGQTGSPCFVVDDSAGSLSSVSPIVQITPPSGTINTGLYIFQNGLSGTATGGYAPVLNYVNIHESISAIEITGLALDHSFGGSSAQGSRSALDGLVRLTSATNSSNPHRDYVGVYGAASAQSSDGGGSGTEKGAFFGIASLGEALSGATNLLNVTAAEFDVRCKAGSSLAFKSIAQYSAYPDDAVKGSIVDAMQWMFNQGSSALWDDGILIDGSSPNGAVWPIKSGGYIIRTQGGPSTVSLKDNGVWSISTGASYFPQSVLENTSNNNSAGYVLFQKHRAGAANNGAVQINDTVGSLQWYAKDQSGNYQCVGSIFSYVTAVGASSVGSVLALGPTTAPVLNITTSGINVTGTIYSSAATPAFGSHTTITNGAGTSLGTLTNAPFAGAPSKWIPYDDNGTIRHFPAW